MDVRFNFIRDHVEKKNVRIEYACMEKQLADIFTKPLNEARFIQLKTELGMIEMEP